MKEQEPQHEHLMREHKDEEQISELSERLAPLEESAQNVGSGHKLQENPGTFDLDTGALKLPAGLEESEGENRLLVGLDPVVIFILIFLIAFIAFIAYLVYKMPAPAK